MGALWVDASNGAAGDMLLAALIDAGADVEAVRAGLARLPVEQVALEVSEVRRYGLRARRVTVSAPDSHAHRGLAEVTQVIEGGGLAEPVRRFAVDSFRRLAEAEARVHGVDPAQVHFHEVGALDAIADVVGCGLALHALGLLGGPRRVVSPVAVGSGTVDAAHGRLPVPAPAVLELLAGAGAPIAEHPARRELCTPTGAALLAGIATGWGPPPAGTVRAVGVGAGSADPAGHPNVVRLLLLGSPASPGESAPGETGARPVAAGAAPVTAAGDDPVGGPAGDWREESLWQVEATVDDLDPRRWPELLAELRAAGAADAWCTPALMHKGRPGQVLTVLVAPGLVDLISRVLFTETPTLGVRVLPVRRRALRRDQVTVRVAAGTVRVKRGLLDGRVVTVQPEYEDAYELARRTGTPVADVIADARHRAADPPADPTRDPLSSI
jgi:hypothetical protein